MCISTTGLDAAPDAPFLQRLVFKGILQWVLRHPYADMALMEEYVRASALDWTIVRSARLTNGPRTGRYRAAVDRTLRNGWSISRADLAEYVLTHLDDPATIRARVEVAY